jgi:iron(III) transport system permease protein
MSVLETELPPTSGGHSTGAGARKLRSLFGSQGLILAVVIAIVMFLVLVPIVYLFDGTFVRDGRFTLDFMHNAYAADGLLRMVWNSLLFGIGTTAVSMALGTALAYLVARTDVPMKGLVYAAALIPMIIPGVLHTIAWIFLASPQIGTLNKLIAPVVGPAFFDIFTMWGMVFVEGIHTAPVVFLLLFAAFKNMDSSLEESALMSGASMPAVIRKVTLPMVRPALMLSALIVMIRALSAFEVPQLLGAPSGIWVFTSKIYTSLTGFPVDYGTAGAYSIGLLLLLAIFAASQSRMSKNARSYQTVTGKGFRPAIVRLGRFRLLAGLLVLGYFFVSCVMPIAVLVYASLQGFYSPPTWATIHHLTLENYTAVFSGDDTVTAFKNSLLLAFGSATIIMFLTAIIAWVVVRRRIRGAATLNALSMMPLGIPGLVLGVALLFFYLRVPLPIYGSLWILLIAYVTVFLPYGVTYASSAMYQIADELEESARVSGASFWTVFRKVTVPLLMPGLVTGWTFIVLVSIRELGASLLLYTPGKQVLSILIWEDWGDGKLTQLAALGVVMIAMLVAIVVIARKVGAKVGVKS